MHFLVAMSGGVDSAVAAALLHSAGHDVTGVTARLADLSDRGLGPSRCCSASDLEVASQVCRHLGVPHFVYDLEHDFHREVLHPFVDSYLAGLTPSPCPRCNSRVKLGRLIPLALELGAAGVATGHYARWIDGPGGVELWRGRDRAKDQSYFLFELTREQLARLSFPLGELQKDEVRALARELGLPNAGREESQEVCFVPPGGSYARVIETLAPERLPGDGDIVDGQGNVVGRHLGFHRFTIGQRRGLGVAAGRPVVVVGIEPEHNRVVIGDQDGAGRSKLLLGGVNWLGEEMAEGRRVGVQVRARHEPAPAALELLPGLRATVKFEAPVTAPAPGQAAVFYEGDRVVGGGWIERAE
jgi:tRNA-specific 2-thiouridylase